MKKLVAATVSIYATLLTAPAFAGVIWSPEAEMSDNDPTAALVLLALIGIVIATGQISGRNKAEIMEPGAPVEE